MKKRFVPLIVASATALASGGLSANQACKTITGTLPASGVLGQLVPPSPPPVDCTPIWNALQASAQFPDVFQNNRTVPGFCFVSTGTMPVSIGGKPYAISTVSAWTNEFMPAFPPPPYSLGQDNLATVATQVTVYNASNRLMGRFYTRDTIDLSGIIGGTAYTASEQDVIVGGTGIFTNARGAYRIGTALGMGGAVNITNIAGNICNVGE